MFKRKIRKQDIRLSVGNTEEYFGGIMFRKKYGNTAFEEIIQGINYHFQQIRLNRKLIVYSKEYFLIKSLCILNKIENFIKRFPNFLSHSKTAN